MASTLLIEEYFDGDRLISEESFDIGSLIDLGGQLDLELERFDGIVQPLFSLVSGALAAMPGHSSLTPGMELANGVLSSASTSAPVLQSLERIFGSLEGKSILEIGCSAGHFMYALSIRGAHVLGIDEMAALSYTGNKALSRIGLGSGLIRSGDIREILSREEREYDAIVSTNLLTRDFRTSKEVGLIIDACLTKAQYQVHAANSNIAFPPDVFLRDGIVTRYVRHPSGMNIAEMENTQQVL